MIRRRILLIAAVLAAAVGFGAGQAQAQQSNFQITPPPIPYPYFQAGRFDADVQGLAGSMSAPGMSLGIGGAAGAGRYAFNEFLAADGALGLFGMGGSLTSGGVPLTPIGAGLTPSPDGSSALSGFLGNMGFDLEVQPIHTKSASIIVFGGPLLDFMNFTDKSPYKIFNGVTTKTGYTDTLTITGSLGGLQAGVQGGFAIGDLKIAPFIMMTSVSGTISITDDPGIVGNSGSSLTATVPTQTSTSMGADFIYVPWGLSAGSMLQQMAHSGANKNNVSTFIFQVGWHFGNADKYPEEQHASRARNDGLYRPRI